jgi:hypothetical protein
LTLATGCSSTQHAQAPAPDPILGQRTPPGMPLPTDSPKADSGAVPTPPQAFGPSPGTPLTPASMTSSNPATLAGTGWQRPLGQPTPLDDSYHGPPLLPGQGTLGTKTPQVQGAPAPNPNPKVEQVPDAGTTSTPAAPVTPTGSWQPTTPLVHPVEAAQPTNSELLLKQLQDKGVVNQKQDVVPEGIHLTCYIPRPSGGLRILEATGADYAAAAQAILQQLNAPP